ncbi:hypothetical protein LTR62_007004 [Meristemomyces frigidus]|uniref:HPP transmembrane region domain-containing protein n=1 Tax=Meristemomyces frigidus TaxID=1508187 RepID=A0AAN7TF83_9PEZI|nr:hypothetical protein LTR62_007004 [Meristemomyces frigidus]
MPSEKSRLYNALNINIDHFINPFVPSNRLSSLPKPISHFLGVRQKEHVEPPLVYQWVLTFIATVGSLCLVGGLFNTAPGIVALKPPVLIASLGASAVLDYSAMRSPLSQPRNSILGQTFSAIMGVGIAKLFQHSPHFFANYAWVSGAVGCASASLVMSITNTVHPPGGATAVLASTEVMIIAMGWWFVPLILLESVLMLAVACLLNNLGRQYPVFWWTPSVVGAKLRRKRREERDAKTVDRDGSADVDNEKLERQASESESERTLRNETSNRIECDANVHKICILPYKISLPSHIEVTADEMRLLTELQLRVRAHDETGASG